MQRVILAIKLADIYAFLQRMGKNGLTVIYQLTEGTCKHTSVLVGTNLSTAVILN